MTHGASQYRRGCRCNTCKTGHATQNRQYHKPVSNPKKRGPAKGVSHMVKADRNRPLSDRRYLPAEPFIPYIEQMIAKHGLAAITAQVGADANGLAKIVRREKRYVSFMVIDRLFSAMDRPDLWHTELADIYEGAA